MQNFLGIFSKSGIADYYDIDVRTLNSWINEYPELVNALQKYGYYENQKVVTIKQTEIIFEFLGTPAILEKKPEKSKIKVPIRTYNKTETANFYKISLKTLKKIIQNIEDISFINENKRKKYDYSEIKTIFHYLGTPYMEEKCKIRK